MSGLNQVPAKDPCDFRTESSNLSLSATCQNHSNPFFQKNSKSLDSKSPDSKIHRSAEMESCAFFPKV